MLKVLCCLKFVFFFIFLCGVGEGVDIEILVGYFLYSIKYKDGGFYFFKLFF